MVYQDENRDVYVKKMDRQIREWQAKVKDLEQRAKERDAERNTRVKREMDTLRRRIEETQEKLNDLKTGGEGWPEAARRVSGTYRKMKQTAASAGQDVKRK